ncbi:Bgt-4638, partial [Blumeria graminis f. sp. tritici]
DLLQCSNNSKISLTTGASNVNASSQGQENPARSFSLGRRHADGLQNNSKTHYNTLPISTSSLASPTTGASSAFGLGSGAFASFGNSKTSKTPGAALDFSNVMGSTKAPNLELREAITNQTKTSTSEHKHLTISSSTHILRHNWMIWFRPPISKSNGFIQYEKTLHPIAGFGSVEDFLTIYRHLKRPSSLPPVSDYHIFKKGIRPVWEDDENRKGGKWIVRMKKGLADRYWEDLVFATIGEQFAEASEEVCGIVLSVRNGEDILSIWTRNDGGRVLKIRYLKGSKLKYLYLRSYRETMKRILGFPPDTKVEWKSHDSSIQHRTAIDEHRKEKSAHHISNAGRNANRITDDVASSPLSKK